jgi:hypothetical protein
MDHIYAELMNKTKKSKTGTQKYKILSCQKTIDVDKDTTSWIELKELIKNNTELRIFDAILLKTRKIVVKIGKSIFLLEIK